MTAPNDSPSALKNIYVYFGLACVLTWSSALPATLSFLAGRTPSAGATAGAGFSAFGPLLAALLLASREGRRSEVFQIRTPSSWPLWALLGLGSVVLLRILSAALAWALGFELSNWIYLPVASTQIAAMIVFPLGEEFGWRGYAYPRLRDRFGVVKGSLIVGIMWSLWHLGYMVDMKTGELDWGRQLHSLISLPLYSLLLAWFMEKARGSLAVAIAFHAAAHLNHIELAPLSEVGFQLLHLVVVGVAALFAARSLLRQSKAHPMSAH